MGYTLRQMMRAVKKHRWRFRGIGADAAALGVDRNHLYRVLTGERPGKLLLLRYTNLKTSTPKVSHETKSL
jgi:hypothetical protein